MSRVLLFGERLAEVRIDFGGGHGPSLLAGALGVPLADWLGYEAGRAMPGEVLLALIDLTGVEPHWLLTGLGPKYRARR
jgi:hypothetical protein